MLVAIDLQNDIFDDRGSGYAKWTERVKDGIEERIKKAVEKDEPIIYTRNLYPEFEHENRSEESIRFDEAIYPQFRELLETHGEEYTKTFYGIPPDEAKSLLEKYREDVDNNRPIEFVGAETNICILANIMVIQNVFPQAEIILNKRLVASTSDKLHDMSIEVLSNMNVTITG
ncbi:cysteine hydrolase family protein [Salinicoccus sp. YB14-2]|uniref:cysteine hydrolase family protein n=1 Tax=Salinicoccus sp. YB14-2 TaxID=1572701 RepID=UPI00068C5281|nr:isochorismatase family protein [Salinicoccus sp. YB14-2]